MTSVDGTADVNGSSKTRLQAGANDAENFNFSAALSGSNFRIPGPGHFIYTCRCAFSGFIQT